MEKIYIVGAKRSAIGAFGGSLKDCSAGTLAGQVIQAALVAAQVKPEAVDEVIVGNVISAGQGMGVGRQAALAAGIPQSVPAYSINMVCGSGMKSVMDAVSHIKAGDAAVVVAAGVEVMSQIPFATPASLRDGHKMGTFEIKDLLIHDGLTDVFNQYHMGVTAENVAKQFTISREAQDEFALASQMKATAAIEAGHFKREIVPISVKKRRETVIFDTDEYPKPNTTLAALQGLRAAFDAQGTVTAGNASGINDGASAVIIASESAVQEFGLTPVAEIISYAQTGLDPQIMGLGPVSAVTQALAKAELSIENIDLFELNEAFAAQALGVVHGLADQHSIKSEAILDKANVNGGAIALGHPLGASGNRILVSLLHELQRRHQKYGVASLCVGGGMGTAIVIKTV
ncbi:acetyl-CoA C-acetyltransferase [Vibrio metoecus]|uniref:Acetyl-CoA C-acetyltransferase n=1 Tax=Vibrio metoecus TaxID=1481663 RepID=A0A271VNN9_VIBMT|nr:acetyl-CoA C-acetyltransferase [Vibrio metoecus]KQB08468.1 acetyl-CoA acetyltransferase [Vibrio metoecus]PAR19646.1 acetyl-CoA C-acetyltransferase [Vibrio metoecus]PAR24413.1 acetyl-CoA C-acetyltransferase [Vibrio metoecus]